MPNQDGGETNDSNFEKVCAQMRGTAGMSTPQTFVRSAQGRGAAQFFMRVVPREKGVGENNNGAPFECQTSFVAVDKLALASSERRRNAAAVKKAALK